MSCLTSWRLCGGAVMQSRPPITNSFDNVAFSWVLSNSFAVVVLYLTEFQSSANPYQLYLKHRKVLIPHTCAHDDGAYHKSSSHVFSVQTPELPCGAQTDRLNA